MAHIKFKDFPQEIKDLWRRRVTDETFYGKPDEFIENRRSSGFTWVNTPEGSQFWRYIMRDSDFRPYYKRYGFAVGDTVCLSDVGKAEYADSASNPHDEIGHVESIGPEMTIVIWTHTGTNTVTKNAYRREDLIRSTQKVLEVPASVVPTFAVGDTVMLSEVGEHNYDNSYIHPWDTPGVIMSLGADDCCVVHWEGRDFLKRYNGYELKLVNNINKEDDIISRITPKITSGKTPRGTVICSPRSKITLGS